MNIGYIYDIINKMLVGIIACNNDCIAYYIDVEPLENIINTLLMKENIISIYGKDEMNKIFIEYCNIKDKSFLHGFSYLLPFPYHIDKLEYKKIEVNELYDLYKSLKAVNK